MKLKILIFVVFLSLSPALSQAAYYIYRAPIPAGIDPTEVRQKIISAISRLQYTSHISNFQLGNRILFSLRATDQNHVEAEQEIRDIIQTFGGSFSIDGPVGTEFDEPAPVFEKS
jgi:hypothetical protein